MRRFLSVWLPRWSIERYMQKNQAPSRLRENGPRPTQIGNTPAEATEQKYFVPFALVVSGAGGLKITSVNRAAEEAGVGIGSSLTDAKALCPALETDQAASAADDEALEKLTLWCLQYSPMVTPHFPDGFALDISGCAHLFGGEQPMLEQISAKMQGFHLTARLAIADTIGGAWAGARFGKATLTVVEEGQVCEFLSRLPLMALRLDVNIVQRLQKLGLRHIGALLKAPEAPLTSRFGRELLNRLHQATGRVPEIFGPLVPPPDYHLGYPFIEPVVQLEAVEATLGILAERMMEHLKQARKGARQLEVRLFRIDGHVERLIVGTSRLCDEAGHITLLFQESLSRLRDDLDMGFGFELMTMSAFDVENTEDVQQGWIGSEKEMGSPQDLNRLLDRFGNRFGFDRVTRFVPEESYIPERAFRKIMAGASKVKGAPWQGKCSKERSRPFLLFTPPEPVTVLAEVPDGPPLRFKWRRQLHQVTRSDGPERLSPEWWRGASDDGLGQTRDYYRIEDNAGYRFWLFRDGLYDREQDQPRWYLHGIFP